MNVPYYFEGYVAFGCDGCNGESFQLPPSIPSFTVIQDGFPGYVEVKRFGGMLYENCPTGLTYC
jgi:hypothetical protein